MAGDSNVQVAQLVTPAPAPPFILCSRASWRKGSTNFVPKKQLAKMSAKGYLIHSI
jgi:hypothetical protein